MSEIFYRLIETKLQVEEESFDSYGIVCLEESKGELTEKKRIEDISVCREQVQEMIASFEKSRLLPEELLEAIEEALEKEYTFKVLSAE